MVDFLELAVRLQGRVPKIIKDPAESPCGMVFADARSILRGNVTVKDQRILHQTITFVSEADTGQPILRIDYNNKRSTEALLLASLLNVFKGRDLEIHLTHLEMDASTWQFR